MSINLNHVITNVNTLQSSYINKEKYTRVWKNHYILSQLIFSKQEGVFLPAIQIAPANIGRKKTASELSKDYLYIKTNENKELIEDLKKFYKENKSALSKLEKTTVIDGVEYNAFTVEALDVAAFGEERNPEKPGVFNEVSYPIIKEIFENLMKEKEGIKLFPSITVDTLKKADEYTYNELNTLDLFLSSNELIFEKTVFNVKQRITEAPLRNRILSAKYIRDIIESAWSTHKNITRSMNKLNKSENIDNELLYIARTMFQFTESQAVRYTQVFSPLNCDYKLSLSEATSFMLSKIDAVQEREAFVRYVVDVVEPMFSEAPVLYDLFKTSMFMGIGVDGYNSNTIGSHFKNILIKYGYIQENSDKPAEEQAQEVAQQEPAKMSYLSQLNKIVNNEQNKPISMQDLLKLKQGN